MSLTTAYEYLDIMVQSILTTIWIMYVQSKEEKWNTKRWFFFLLALADVMFIGYHSPGKTLNLVIMVNHQSYTKISWRLQSTANLLCFLHQYYLKLEKPQKLFIGFDLTRQFVMQN
jgi:hypothetical protein